MQIKFVKDSAPKETILLLLSENLDIPDSFQDIPNFLDINIEKYIKNQKFTGKENKTLIIPTDDKRIKRVVVLGLGKPGDATTYTMIEIGNTLHEILKKEKAEVVSAHVSDTLISKNTKHLFDIFFGCLMANYKFDKYITKKSENDIVELESIEIVNSKANICNLEFEKYSSIQQGISLAQDLMNEPPNILTPKEFASRCKDLEKYGLEVEILDQKEMKALGMRALLGVAQGSTNEPKLAIMRWNGNKDNKEVLSFVGKGVTFDSGGLSLKPANAMIGMKYDMGGAATVTGLMASLALRKAKINAIGVIALVENMPGGKAQRPEDIVKSMSGQTIEVLNTDAEGRLVLADALWYTQSVYKPELMINFATLTGAILVTFADKYAGLFSNNDLLSERLFDASVKTGEKIWRLPLDKEFDKMIDSKIADMQNISKKGGAGSITAAQFLQRFVNNVPWAHIDIAGVTKMDKDQPNAFGIRLLNEFIEAHYE